MCSANLSLRHALIAGYVFRTQVVRHALIAGYVFRTQVVLY